MRLDMAKATQPKTTKTKPRSKAAQKAAPIAPAKTPIHQWTHDADEVFILRFSDHEGRSHNDFQHPMKIGGVVEVSDWNPAPVCGGGIHGWPWGIGLGDGKDPQWDALWQVYGVKPEDVIPDVDGGPKCKFRTGILRYKGDWHGAALFILSGQMAWASHRAEGAATNSGDRGAATNSGDSGAATNSGDSGAATNSGYSGAAISTGDESSAQSVSPASVAVVTGMNGKVKGGPYGCIGLAWWNDKHERFEMRCAAIGCGDGSDGTLKAGVWYRLNAQGEFVEVA